MTGPDEADAPRAAGAHGREGGAVDGTRRGDRRALTRSKGLSDQTQQRLGNHLRAMYDEVLQQPVPDRFRELIERLESRSPGEV